MIHYSIFCIGTNAMRMSMRCSAGVAVSLLIRFVRLIIFLVMALINDESRSALSTEQEKGEQEGCGEHLGDQSKETT